MPDKRTCEELEMRVQDLEAVEQRLLVTEQRLQDEVEYRKLLVEENRDGIVIVGPGGEVVEANRRFAEMLGYSREEVLGLKVWDWDAVFSREQIREFLDACDSTGHHMETQHRRRDGEVIDVDLSNSGMVYRDRKHVFCICRDITEKKRAEREKEQLIRQLSESLAEIKTLRGILPVCSYCKKVRDDRGYWEQVDVYLQKHSDADVSHGICPGCLAEHHPDQVTNKRNRQAED